MVGTSLEDLDFYEEPYDIWLSQGKKTWPNPQNHVATVFYNAEHELEPFVGRLGGVSCRKSRLTANTFRFHAIGKCRAPTAQSFASGMVVFMGATSENTTLHYIHLLRFAFMNMKLKRMPRNGRMLVRNRVCSGFYGPGLDIDNFEPEDRVGIVKHNPSFPGIVYMTTPPGYTEQISLSLFKSGKLIIMGLGPKEARQVYGYVLPVLERNRLKGNNTRSKTTRSIVAIRDELSQRSITKKSYRDCLRDALDSVPEYDVNDPLEAYYHEPVFGEVVAVPESYNIEEDDEEPKTFDIVEDEDDMETTPFPSFDIIEDEDDDVVYQEEDENQQEEEDDEEEDVDYDDDSGRVYRSASYHITISEDDDDSEEEDDGGIRFVRTKRPFDDMEMAMSHTQVRKRKT